MISFSNQFPNKHALLARRDVQAIKKVIDEWDPIGMSPGEVAPRSEYDLEVLMVWEGLQVLDKRVLDLESELATHIYSVFSYQFDHGVFDRSHGECIDIAKAILVELGTTMAH